MQLFIMLFFVQILYFIQFPHDCMSFPEWYPVCIQINIENLFVEFNVFIEGDVRVHEECSDFLFGGYVGAHGEVEFPVLWFITIRLSFEHLNK